MFGKLYSISANTFAETIRQPIFNILTWVAIGLLVLNPSLAAFSLDSGSDVKILKDVGMSTILLFCLLTSAFSAVGVITREIETFTVLTVVSKPVSRPTFILGKFAGVSVAMLVSYYLLALVFLMTVRHGVMETTADKWDMPVLALSGSALLISVLVAGFGNFNYGWNFGTTLLGMIIPTGSLAFTGVMFFDKTFKFQSPFEKWDATVQVLYALILGFFAVMILTSFAVAFATRLGQVMTLMMCSFVFILGLLSDYYFGQRVSEGPLYQFMYALLPNFQFFWVGDAITQEIPVPWSHVQLVATYAGLYILGVLGLGIAMFQTREVG